MPTYSINNLANFLDIRSLDYRMLALASFELSYYGKTNNHLPPFFLAQSTRLDYR